MEGYDDSSYGDAFAGVYDDWYHSITDTEASVAALQGLALVGLPVLELGVGTGRLAIPLAASGLEVHGIDSSAAMLSRLTANDQHRSVHQHTGDMAHELPPGPFGLVFAAYNTFFGLLTHDRQQHCFDAVAGVLAPGGAFVIEAFVPDPALASPTSRSAVTVRSLTAHRVVLSVSISDADHQTAHGQYIDITEAGGVTLRPWAIRYAAPAEIDDMAAQAGLALADRLESFGGALFGPDSTRHVSVYRAIRASPPHFTPAVHDPRHPIP